MLRELSEDIVLLRMLTAEPARTSSKLVRDEQPEQLADRTLSPEHERRIVDCLAFLSAVTDDPEKVSAVCLERCPRGNACVVRLAMNTGVSQELMSGFRQIARSLENCRREGRNDHDGSRELLQVVLAMHRNRILSRLRSKHAKVVNRKKIEGKLPTVLRLQDLTQALSSSEATNSSVSLLAPVVSSLVQGFIHLEAMPSSLVTAGGADDALLSLLELLDDLPSLDVATTYLSSSPKSSFQGQDSLLMTVTKLRKYRAACDFLVKAAQRFEMFCSVSVVDVHIKPAGYQKGKVDEKVFSSMTQRLGLKWTKDTPQKVGMTSTQALTQFRAGMKKWKPKVHAEIQLLFYYESNPQLETPRVICSSKAACFLCELFIRVHGRFLVTKTHGVLYPQWTLPSYQALGIVDGSAQRMDTVTARFLQEIETKIRQEWDKARTKRTHPGESFTSLVLWTPSQISLVPEATSGIGQKAYCQSKSDLHREGMGNSQRKRESIVGSTFEGGWMPQMPSQSFTNIQSVRAPKLDHSSKRAVVSTDAQKREHHDQADARSENSIIEFQDLLDNSELCPNQPDRGLESMHSKPQICTELRPLIDLDGTLQTSATPSIRDHESRAQVIGAKYDVPKLVTHNSDTSHSAHMTRIVDFHDEKLSIHLELPKTADFAMTICQRPPDGRPVIDVATLLPGTETVVDVTGPKSQSAIVLASRDEFGRKIWIEIMWRVPE